LATIITPVVARLPRSLDVVEQGVDQRAPRMTGRRMHHETGRLVQHQHMGVLEQDLERDVLGHELHRLGCRHEVGHEVPRLERGGGAAPRGCAVHQDRALVDVFLDQAAGAPGDPIGEEAIQAEAFRCGVDLELNLVVVFGFAGHQIFDLMWPLPRTRTSITAR
jgi:hypothetical protein